MLRALKNQLRQFADDPNDSFDEKVSKRLNHEFDLKLSKSLKNFVLLLPDMIAQIRIWANDDKVPMEIKRLHGYVLTYLYHPLDLLPEEPNGLFGYLDDAYLVGDVYHRTMMYAKSFLAPPVLDENYSSKISQWLELTRRTLPQETKIMDHLLDELVKGNDKSFHDIVARTKDR